MNKEELTTGGPDPDFGTNGLARLPTTMAYAGEVMWTSGAALAVGASTLEGNFLVTRLLNDGTVDTGFGQDGVIQGQIEQSQLSIATRAFEVENNRTVVVVNTSIDDGGFIPCVTRYTKEGSLDQSYAQGGIARLPYPNALGHKPPPKTGTGQRSTSPAASNAGLTPAGKLIVGWWYISQGKTVIYQLDNTGNLDTSFNQVGYVTYPESLGQSSLSALLVLASGKILAVGEHRDASGIFYPFLARYTATGALDNEFGKDGSGVVELRLEEYANCIVNACIETAAGGLILLGRNAESNAWFIGLESNGNIDRSFKQENIPGVFQWLSAAYDGEKVVAAGTISEQHRMIIARYNVDGSLDTEFGSHSGWTHVDFPGVPDAPTPYDVEAAEQRILIAGGSFVARILA